MDALTVETQKYKTLKQRILAEEKDVDAETLADTLEGITGLHEIVFAVTRGVVLDEANAEALRTYLRDLQARVIRFETRASRRREAVRDAMVEAGLRQLVAPDLTLSIRNGSPSLIVTDESRIPARFWEQREPKLNRLGVLNELRNGAEVAGALLSNAAPVLAVRLR